MEHAPLQAVYIYFDTATFDEIERDEKVKLTVIVEPVTKKLILGDSGSSTRPYWRHNGSSHRLLNPQWSGDHLLSYQVEFCPHPDLSLNFSYRFFMSLTVNRAEVVTAVNKRFENHLTTK